MGKRAEKVAARATSPRPMWGAKLAEKWQPERPLRDPRPMWGVKRAEKWQPEQPLHGQRGALNAQKGRRGGLTR